VKLTTLDQMNLSETLEGDSTSKEKVLKPFWNERCCELTSHLWLPAETDLQDLELTSFDKSLNRTLENSWFSKRLFFRQNKSSPTICSISSTYFQQECVDLEVIKSKSIKLSLTPTQHRTFKHWHDVSRYVYNQALNFMIIYETCEELGVKKPSWMDIKKMFTRTLPEWTKDVPFQIKGIAVKEAVEAFWATLKGHKGKKGKIYFNFRSWKDPVQSCFIPKTAISDNGIYPKMSGKDLKFIESFPEEILDSRLVWRAGKYFLTIPTKQRVSYGENQARVVAIDPGVRVFSTFYGTDSCGFLGQGDFSRIQRLAHYLDNLVSRMSKVTRKQKLRKMKLAAARMREKIKNLVDELHHKVALFLVTCFDCILLPTFETKQMVGRSKRKLQSKTARSLLSFAHYRFKVFLKHKAFECGKEVVEVCEAYTSKTHPETGEVKKVGSAKRIKLLNGQWINRDIVGARNILLRALVDQPHLFSVAVNKCD
jgi:putative transposase